MDVEHYYDEKAPFYDGEYRTPFYRLYNSITWDNIKKYLPEKGLILDAGGGTGQWAIRLAESGYNVVLADISRGMLRQARLKLEEKAITTVTLQRVDIRDMSCFHHNTFDMVLAQGDPLSYCGNAEKAVKEFYRVLVPGGHCIASVDSLHYFVLKLIKMERWDTLTTLQESGSATFLTGFTIRYFTPETLQTLLVDAGFNVVRLVGKPVYLSVIPQEIANTLLKDSKTFEKILEQETLHCDDPSLVGVASHLEIVGKKEDSS